MLEPARRDSFGTAPRTPPARRRPSRRPPAPLVRDLALILIVKFALLTALWWAFFSHPVAPSMRAEPRLVREHVFPGSNDPAIAPETAHAER